MDLKQLGESLAKIGLPILGAALPLPGGAALGAALANMIGAPSAQPQDILAALQANQGAITQAKQFEDKHQEMLLSAILDYETSQAKTQADVIKTEASGESWLQRNWRPMTMLSFVLLLFLYWFGVEPKNVTEAIVLSIFGLLKIGIGGYIGGRSVEKVTKSLPSVVQALKG